MTTPPPAPPSLTAWVVAPPLRPPHLTRIAHAVKQTLFAAVRISPSIHGGLGVFANAPIARGQFVVAFAGSLWARSAACARPTVYAITFRTLGGVERRRHQSSKATAIVDPGVCTGDRETEATATRNKSVDTARVAHLINQADSPDDVNVVALDPGDALSHAREHPGAWTGLTPAEVNVLARYHRASNGAVLTLERPVIVAARDLAAGDELLLNYHRASQADE